MTKTKKTQDFTTGSVTGKMLLFALPLFMSSLLQVAYNMADMVIVGHAAGKIGLSAVSVGGDVSTLLTFLVMGFSNAGSIIISQYVGAKQHDKLSRFMGTLFTTLGVCAITLSVICAFITRQLLDIMHCPAESYDSALSYAFVCIIGLVFIYGYNATSAVFRGLGDSKRPFIFISASAIINIVLDLVFVLGLDMGAFGAGLATIISQAVSFIISGVYLIRHMGEYGIEMTPKDFISIDIEMLSTLVKLGIPMAIKSASIIFSKLFVNSWINSYGVSVSAMAGVANKINSITNLFSNAVNTSGSAMVGQNIGAEKYERVPKVRLTAFGFTFITATILSGCVFFFPEFVFRLFTSDADVLEIAYEYVPIALLIFYSSCLRASMNSLINGSGNYKLNFAVAILDGMVNRIGLSLLFGVVLEMAYYGFWLGDALAGFTPFVIGIVFFLSGKWKTRKYVIKDRK